MTSTAFHLAPSPFIQSDHPAVRRFAEEAVGPATGERERAGRLFAAVRDRIRYDPYLCSDDPATYRASAVLEAGTAFCIPKAVLLAAAARAVGIPARLGFADVRNHLQSDRLAEAMGGTDLFVYHGYTELLVDGRWRKATPAFNAELCARFGVEPLHFDGTADALLHPCTGDGARYMEYVDDHGSYDDLPFDELVAAIGDAYPGIFERMGAGRGTDDPAFAG